MADKPKELNPGDPCPVDGGELAPVVGAEVKKGGALWRCRTCGYYTRFAEKASAAPAPAKK